MHKHSLLGSGRYGLVYRENQEGRDCAAKRYNFRERDSAEAFDAEVTANHKLSTVDSLRGRIPQFYAVDEAERIIYTKRIPSPTLRNAIRDRSIYDLAKIKQFVKETLITIHTAGVCHCDISIENIFSSGILFDFSHAGFSSSNDWERRKQGDFDKLESTFREAERLHRSGVALAMIDSGIDDSSRQKELADLLALTEGTESLLNKLEHIREPSLYLAVAMCRKFRQCRQPWVGVDLFRNYTPPDSETNQQLLFTLKGEVAQSQCQINARDACIIYTDAIEQSSTVLGLAHTETLKLRFAYAHCLEKALQNAEALKVIEALIPDLDSSKFAAKVTKAERYRDSLLVKLGRDSGTEKPRKRRRGETEDCFGKRIRLAKYAPEDSNKETSAGDSIPSSSQIT